MNNNWFKSAVDLLADSIYWVFRQVFELLDNLLLGWKQVQNPYMKLGILVFLIMARIILKQWKQLNRYRKMTNALELICPVCQSNADPLPQTVNRYICRRGHKFNGDVHRR